MLNYKGGETAVVLDKYLNTIREVKINPEEFNIGKGAHSVVFDCTFSNKGKEPLAKFEIRPSIGKRSCGPIPKRGFLLQNIHVAARLLGTHL